jgi:hypothetical protein
MTSPFISFVGRGAASLAAPGVFTDARAYAFGFDADRDAMQALVDTYLNAVSLPTVEYQVFTGRALATFLDVARCTSGTDVIGWVPGRECALWVPLLQKRGLSWRLRLWSPYIFINYTIGMLTGRDVWGWPKVQGSIRMPSASAAARFECRTLTFHPLAAATRGKHQALIAITSSTPLGSGGGSWASVTDAVNAFLGASGQAAVDLLNQLGVSLNLSSVALKQLRHEELQGQAVYRAIVQSPVTVRQFHGGGLLGNNFTMRITTCESHRIVQDFLGIAPGAAHTDIPITWAGRMHVDFEASAGKVVVQSP